MLTISLFFVCLIVFSFNHLKNQGYNTWDSNTFKGLIRLHIIDIIKKHQFLLVDRYSSCISSCKRLLLVKSIPSSFVTELNLFDKESIPHLSLLLVWKQILGFLFHSFSLYSIVKWDQCIFGIVKARELLNFNIFHLFYNPQTIS